MTNFLDRLHARVGDLWWYSAMIFLACRSGDAIQAFIGLWLVPKYVGPQELGAVMPLQQLTSFLTIPLAIVAVVFSRCVNTYATRGEYGKVRSLIRDVLAASLVLFAACTAGAYLLMPFFYERLRIVPGTLTLLVLACGLVTNLGSIIGSAQQGLKRFKTMSIMTLIGAPIRLVTLLVTLPIRALSGYILGQTTPAATTSALSVVDIHKALKPYAPDTSWRKDLPAICRDLLPFAICTIAGSCASTLVATVYRQRLPEIESAAYYLLMRFADMVGFVGASLGMVLFPLAAEEHEKGKENRKLLWHYICGTMAGCLGLAALFFFIAQPILSLSSIWRQYADFAWVLPLLTLAVGPGLVAGTIASYDFACRRNNTTVLLGILNFSYAIFLVSFTGCEFFRGILPDFCVNWMASLHINSLARLTVISICFNVITVVSLLSLSLTSARKTTARRNK